MSQAQESPALTQAEGFALIIDHFTLGLMQARELITQAQETELFQSNTPSDVSGGPVAAALQSMLVRQMVLKKVVSEKIVSKRRIEALAAEVRRIFRLYLNDIEFGSNHVVAVMNGTMVGDHRIEFDRMGLSGTLGRFTCMTCGATLVDHPIASQARNQKKFEFFQAHPHRSIKDIGYQV